MEVRQQHVQLDRPLVFDRDAERTKAGSGIEHEHVSAFEAHLDAWRAGAAAAALQGGAGLDLQLVEADVFDWLQASGEPRYDLLVANAFLDLVDVPALLPLLWRRTAPGRPF